MTSFVVQGLIRFEWSQLGLMSSASADAPDPSCDFEQFLDVHGVAEEPCKNSSAAATKPEATGEICPSRSGEQISRRIRNGRIRRGNVRLLPRLVVKQEEQAEDMNGTDRSQQTSCLLVFGVPKGAADGEGAEQEIAEGCTGFKASEIW